MDKEKFKNWLNNNWGGIRDNGKTLYLNGRAFSDVFEKATDNEFESLMNKFVVRVTEDASTVTVETE